MAPTTEMAETAFVSDIRGVCSRGDLADGDASLLASARWLARLVLIPAVSSEGDEGRELLTRALDRSVRIASVDVSESSSSEEAEPERESSSSETSLR